MENRASKYYQNFIDTFIFYNSLFESSISPADVLNLPYPLYKDIILAQVEELKRKKKELDKQLESTRK